MKGIVIAGPTGVGKTELSIKLAKALNAEIISADSAQVYEEMNIGTAKIEENEMQGIIHHMIDVVEPVKKYSVGDYQRKVDEILNSNEEKNILLVGGTGLYIDSVVRGLSALPESDLAIREKLMNEDGDKLFEILKEIDPESAESIHPNNKRRVERAVEVFYQTGEKFSILSKKNIKGNNFKFLKVALERDREHLYDRINLRVEIMMENGLLEEVKYLYKKYGDILKKINIIGYSELISYINEEITLEDAKELIKKNSRNYAKRQFTWFKNDHEYIWYDLDKMTQDEIFSDILQRFNAL
ncbi:MAG: tRNA (adenosine(37)-N6)-dimethylallyltransferase MiaA [Cetobacterium sp.]|uniref:tRNA (adenosine(37)-N6)-dimethylallyltransferase MiaA n=1 Tax=Cetobacterium TaxID=180162 RepID=UPI001F05541D|nr:tRNA (adenosine(37)-N6)-dimethylallyltransferase MiaA [Cetobacterium somerae]MCX3067993.1 tRNA (adenosine(37)-N6)-dimethylallyltransferase MiaA [Cetobacterium somerae]UPO97083.1 tRNA (adenosine(37)-N6)-dimethylallyltransferase MiaA [Cetobacterium somerae]